MQIGGCGFWIGLGLLQAWRDPRLQARTRRVGHPDGVEVVEVPRPDEELDVVGRSPHSEHVLPRRELW